MRAQLALPAVLAVVVAGCSAEKRTPASLDPACFGTRVLSFRDLTAEVLIPPGEVCEGGTFRIVFTRGTDTLTSLTAERDGTVGFLGTSDVDGDGRGEFFVATQSIDEARRGVLYGYTESDVGVVAAFPLADLDSTQRAGYRGGDRFGFGGSDQLVRAFPTGTAGDTSWFGYSNGERRWRAIERPSWVR